MVEKGPDVFVHHASLVMEGFRTLQEGQAVTFEPVEGPKGIQAKNVVPGAVAGHNSKEDEIPKHEVFTSRAVAGSESKETAISQPKSESPAGGSERTKSGMVKWWNDAKGYGFIVTKKGPDVFVHHASLVMEGFRTLQEDQLVTFEPVEGPKGIQAKNVVPGALTAPDTKEPEQAQQSELLALALFGKSIRLVSLTPDGTYRFIDDFAQLHNIYYVFSQETAEPANL